MNRSRSVIFILALGLLDATPGVPAPGPDPGAAGATVPRGPSRPSPGSVGSETLPPAVAEALSGVVSVTVREVTRVPIFRDGRFEMEPVAGHGAGSGVVVSEDGLIITSAHVISGSSDVRIQFPGGGDLEARVVSIDEASDLALLRAAGSGLHPLVFSASLPPSGTPAFILGDRGGDGPEISWGRIGSHRRVRVGARPLEFWCEVEGQVGPGNSGGAIVDAEGRLLGIPGLQIRYAADSSRPAMRPSGLFVPAAHVHRTLMKMKQGSPAAWPWLGLLLDDPLLLASEGQEWNDDRGVRVRSIINDSPAAEAGFEHGDRILAIGARRPRDNFEALDAALDLSPGGHVTVEVERGGVRLELTVSVGTRPADPRPDPLDDFALHTGFRLAFQEGEAPEKGPLVLTGATPRARREMPQIEADLFTAGAILESLLPGQDALAGFAKRPVIASSDDLAALLPRCFVGEQFVALAHWSGEGRRTLDRAHFNRKIHPVVL
ncbi:MAG TPA: S1C family serine protease [Candidatus Polarisedimenticolia bacterium]